MIVPTGGVQPTVIVLAVADVPERLVGGFGNALVVMGLDADDATDIPCTLVAFTLNVYDVLANSPTMVTGLVAPVAVILPGLLVTVYVDIGNVPAETINSTDAAVSDNVLATMDVGGLGNVFAETEEEETDVPLTFVAVKLNE